MQPPVLLETSSSWLLAGKGVVREGAADWPQRTVRGCASHLCLPSPRWVHSQPLLWSCRLTPMNCITWAPGRLDCYRGSAIRGINMMG